MRKIWLTLLMWPLIALPISAAKVLAAAQAYGQEDDISVLSVRRAASLTAVLA
jgi:hypothetical protein